MATPLVFYPGFLHKKRIFPEYWPRGPGTHRTLLQSQHGPVPELWLSLPWRTAAGGTRHRFPVPIYTLGVDKTNFSRILTTPWGKGLIIPRTRSRSRTWILNTWTPQSCIPGFSINRMFLEYWPRVTGIHRTLLQSPHGPLPKLCLAVPCLPLLGAPGKGLLCPFTPWSSINRIFPKYWLPRWERVNNTHNSH